MADASFDQAFPALYTQARRLAYRITGDHHVAEDIASEALVRALLHWGRVGSLPHRDGWVMRVTTNLALDGIRKNRHRNREAALAAEHPPDESDVHVLRAALVEALLLLPRRQREAIVLVHLLGYSTNDAANAMRVSPSSVGQHIRRGMDRLRPRLTPDEFSFEVSNDANH